MAAVTTPTTAVPSAQESKDVLEELLPPQGRWSEDEYLVLTDHRNRLVEYTDGFLEVLPTPTDTHQSVLKFLFLAPCCWPDSRSLLPPFSMLTESEYSRQSWLPLGRETLPTSL
jgi:hypothetical protein